MDNKPNTTSAPTQPGEAQKPSTTSTITPAVVGTAEGGGAAPVTPGPGGAGEDTKNAANSSDASKVAAAAGGDATGEGKKKDKSEKKAAKSAAKASAPEDASEELQHAPFKTGAEVQLDFGVSNPDKPLQAIVSGVYHDKDGWYYAVDIHTSDAVSILGKKAGSVTLEVPAFIVKARAEESK